MILPRPSFAGSTASARRPIAAQTLECPSRGPAPGAIAPGDPPHARTRTLSDASVHRPLEDVIPAAFSRLAALAPPARPRHPSHVRCHLMRCSSRSGVPFPTLRAQLPARTAHRRRHSPCTACVPLGPPRTGPGTHLSLPRFPPPDGANPAFRAPGSLQLYCNAIRIYARPAYLPPAPRIQRPPSGLDLPLRARGCDVRPSARAVRCLEAHMCGAHTTDALPSLRAICACVCPNWSASTGPAVPAPASCGPTASSPRTQPLSAPCPDDAPAICEAVVVVDVPARVHTHGRRLRTSKTRRARFCRGLRPAMSISWRTAWISGVSSSRIYIGEAACAFCAVPARALRCARAPQRLAERVALLSACAIVDTCLFRSWECGTRAAAVHAMEWNEPK